MFEYFIKKSDFGTLWKFASPDFFKVVPSRELLNIFNQLRSNSKNLILFHQRLAQMDQYLEKLSRERRYGPGELALILFFMQVLKQQDWIIDFRFQSFLKTELILWRPKPYFYSMSPEFLSGIRRLYTGFYLKDEPQFEQGLRDLAMEKVKPEILAHFGASDQTHLRFELKAFEQTFAAIFKKCARHKVTLHPEFFVLGATLLGLYENLESLGGEFDVKSSFMKALQAPDDLREAL